MASQSPQLTELYTSQFVVTDCSLVVPPAVSDDFPLDADGVGLGGADAFLSDDVGTGAADALGIVEVGAVLGVVDVAAGLGDGVVDPDEAAGTVGVEVAVAVLVGPVVGGGSVGSALATLVPIPDRIMTVASRRLRRRIMGGSDLLGWGLGQHPRGLLPIAT